MIIKKFNHQYKMNTLSKDNPRLDGGGVISRVRHRE